MAPLFSTTVPSANPLPITPSPVQRIRRLDVEPPTAPPSPACDQYIWLIYSSQSPSTPLSLPVLPTSCVWFFAPSYPWSALVIIHGFPLLSLPLPLTRITTTSLITEPLVPMPDKKCPKPGYLPPLIARYLPSGSKPFSQ